MRVGYLECFAGISGDMLMGALLDAGVSIDRLRETLGRLDLGAGLRVSKVQRSGIQATKIEVLVDGRLAEAPAASGPNTQATHRHPEHGHSHEHAHGHGRREHPAGRNLAVIRGILLRAGISPRTRSLSLSAFEALAEAEARIHGVPVEQVHFHEAGAADAIVDIVLSAAAIEELALDHWYCSPVNVGGGFVDCAHGRFPVPAPATAELLRNLPTYSAGIEAELATPTGAALLRALNCDFEPKPVMRTLAIGYGAGARDPAGFPNVLRLSIGEVAESGKFRQEMIAVLECAIDDLSPQVMAHTAQLALERGALDVMSSPVAMKKGRLGTLLTVLCSLADAGHLQELLFRETSTLGMRVRQEQRILLDREVVPVETEFGTIRVKTGSWRGEELNAAPEFEDCRRAAEAHQAPLKTVMQAALAGYRRQSPAPVKTGARP